MSSFAPPDPYDCQDCDNNARAVWAIKNPQLYVLPQKAVWHRRFRVETIPLFIGFLARRLFYLSHYICREIDAALFDPRLCVRRETRTALRLIEQCLKSIHG